MTKLLFALFLIISLFLSSCSVYEDIYFLEGGKVKYQITIDASELAALGEESSLNINKGLPSDSIIYFSQLIKDSLKTIPAEIAQNMEDISSLYVHIKRDKAKSEYKISICGDFDNTEAFIKAFSSLSKLEEYIKENKPTAGSEFPTKILFDKTLIAWDGKVFKRIIDTTTETEDAENTLEESDQQIKDTIDAFAKLFSQGRMIVKYHFPKKIKNVSNDKATFTLDGKTAIIEYPAMLFLEPTQDFSIEIETE
jgi:hypothetical protein